MVVKKTKRRGRGRGKPKSKPRRKKVRKRIKSAAGRMSKSRSKRRKSRSKRRKSRKIMRNKFRMRSENNPVPPKIFEHYPTNHPFLQIPLETYFINKIDRNTKSLNEMEKEYKKSKQQNIRRPNPLNLGMQYQLYNIKLLKANIDVDKILLKGGPKTKDEEKLVQVIYKREKKELDEMIKKGYVFSCNNKSNDSWFNWVCEKIGI